MIENSNEAQINYLVNRYIRPYQLPDTLEAAIQKHVLQFIIFLDKAWEGAILEVAEHVILGYNEEKTIINAIAYWCNGYNVVFGIDMNSKISMNISKFSGGSINQEIEKMDFSSDKQCMMLDFMLDIIDQELCAKIDSTCQA